MNKLPMMECPYIKKIALRHIKNMTKLYMEEKDESHLSA